MLCRIFHPVLIKIYFKAPPLSSLLKGADQAGTCGRLYASRAESSTLGSSLRQEVFRCQNNTPPPPAFPPKFSHAEDWHIFVCMAGAASFFHFLFS